MAKRMKVGGEIHQTASGGMEVLAGKNIIYFEKLSGHTYGHEE